MKGREKKGLKNLGGDVEKMKKKEVTVAVMLIVALVATMVFVSAVSSSEDSPGQVVTMQQATVYRADSNVIGEVGTGGEGTRADYNVNGGWLKVDDDEGTVCTGNAQGAQLAGVSPAGNTCKVTIKWDYIDDSGLSGSWVILNLTVPGDEDEKRIYDWPLTDQSDDGTLQATFTVYPNRRYTFEIYGEHGDNSFSDSASIVT